MSLNMSFLERKVLQCGSHTVTHITCSTRFLVIFIADAVCRSWGLVLVGPPAQGHEWAPSGPEVSGDWDAAWKESGTYCWTWPRPPSSCPRCLAGSGGRNTATGTFSVRPSSFLLQPGVLIRPQFASSTSSWKSDQNTRDELFKEFLCCQFPKHHLNWYAEA